MRSLFSFLFALFLGVSLVGGVFAQDVATPSDVAASTQSLTISDITVVDTKTLDISFNEPIDTNTVRVTISEQSTRANVRVGEYTGGTDQNTVRVSLLDLLDPNTDYTLTINTAMSMNGQTINAGVDAIRDFHTPSSLGNATGSSVPSELNAPTNTSAVTVTDSNENAQDTPVAESDAHTGSEAPVAVAEELPQTGTDAVLIILFALGVSGLLFMSTKKRF